MKPKHTPGPWRLNGALVDGQKRWWIEAGSTNPLSSAMTFPATNPTIEDARLISASPELLEACRSALADVLYDEHSEHTLCPATLEQLRSAIRKATGSDD